MVLINKSFTDKIISLKNPKHLEEEMNQLKENYSYVEKFTKIGTWTYYPDSGEIFWSEEIYHILGIDSKSLTNGLKSFNEYIHPDDLKKVAEFVESAIKGKGYNIEFRIIDSSGNLKFLKSRTEVILDDSGRVKKIIGIVQDITESREVSQIGVSYITSNDKLIGLPSRVDLLEKLNQHCRYLKLVKKHFALMMLDVSDVKNVNYSLGFDVIDSLLDEIYERLKSYLGQGVYISRYYDDIFAIILQGKNELGDFETIGKGIINQFKKPFKIDNYQFTINVNLGICSYPKDADKAEDLIKNARLALIMAKKEGKNLCRFYSSDMEMKLYGEFALRSDLIKAIKEEQFIINYHPVVSLSDNSILAAEALLRWNHPEWGIIGPSQFIHLAEETGLIVDIGKWALREVCRNYKSWAEKGLPSIKVSVNFSPVQLYEEDFAENVLGIIKEYGLDPKFLIVEITESVLLQDVSIIVRNLKKLQANGIQVTIDDFGTCYSSLMYLNNFNIDIIKIGQSFLKKVSSSEISKSIMKFVVQLAKELKIKVIAEGIESYEQLMFLKNIGCYMGQGFIFGEPISVKDFEKVLSKGNMQIAVFNDITDLSYADRRKFFRVKFIHYLEADLTVQEIRGEKVNVGSTKVLIKNMGPGGLCFISNIRFPSSKDLILQFTTEMMGEEFKFYGSPVWAKRINKELNEYGLQLYEYGVEFTLDENERKELIKTLNKAQIKMKRNELFVDGRFISITHIQYFSNLLKNKGSDTISNNC